MVHMHNILLWSQYYGLYNLDSGHLHLYIMTGFMAHAYFTRVILLTSLFIHFLMSTW